MPKFKTKSWEDKICVKDKDLPNQYFVSFSCKKKKNSTKYDFRSPTLQLGDTYCFTQGRTAFNVEKSLIINSKRIFLDFFLRRNIQDASFRREAQKLISKVNIIEVLNMNGHISYQI